MWRVVMWTVFLLLMGCSAARESAAPLGENAQDQKVFQTPYFTATTMPRPRYPLAEATYSCEGAEVRREAEGFTICFEGDKRVALGLPVSQWELDTWEQVQEEMKRQHPEEWMALRLADHVANEMYMETNALESVVPVTVREIRAGTPGSAAFARKVLEAGGIRWVDREGTLRAGKRLSEKDVNALRGALGERDGGPETKG